METLIKRYKYGANYIPDYEEFLRTMMNKTIIPYQIEMQPGPEKGKLCWMKCPYCYGLSAKDTGERPTKEHLIRTLNEAADGGVKKVIFAGYCTDPLNYEHIEDLLEVAIDKNMVFGFNTKALKISERLVELLSDDRIMPTSYFNVSVDAGADESYNKVHGARKGSKLYCRVLSGITDLSDSLLGNLDISASYLVMAGNSSEEEIKLFARDFRAAGCNLIRFAFPQPPRGKEKEGQTAMECWEYRGRLQPLIKKLDRKHCRVILADTDLEHHIFQKPRTLPCLARWVFPTIGFDGWMYPCSQSAAPTFRPMALGDMKTSGFWESFYDYDLHSMTENEKRMIRYKCRCDRKAHLVNGKGGT